jgi:hypothetical protein
MLSASKNTILQDLFSAHADSPTNDDLGIKSDQLCAANQHIGLETLHAT